MKYLESISGDFVGIEEYLVDHPSFKERLKLLPPEDLHAPPTKPALTAGEWKALKSICNETKPFSSYSR